MIDKKNIKAEMKQETFSISKMVKDGKTYILRFKNNLGSFAESGKYPYQIGIATQFHANQNGFPKKEENNQLLNMEQILEKEFETEDTAIFVGVIMGEGMKELVFYTGKPKEAVNICERIKEEIKHHELQYVIREDPSWEVYKLYGSKAKN